MIYTSKTMIRSCEMYTEHTVCEVTKVEMVDELVRVQGKISRIDEMIDQRGLRVLMFFIQDETGTIEIDYQVREDTEIELFNNFNVGDTVTIYGDVMDDLFSVIYRIYAREIVKW